MQDLPQILDHGFGQTFLAHHELFYGIGRLIFDPESWTSNYITQEGGGARFKAW
jgi:hypothetical protein